jgi:hypothetical protein
VSGRFDSFQGVVDAVEAKLRGLDSSCMWICLNENLYRWFAKLNKSRAKFWIRDFIYKKMVVPFFLFFA